MYSVEAAGPRRQAPPSPAQTPHAGAGAAPLGPGGSPAAAEAVAAAG